MKKYFLGLIIFSILLQAFASFGAETKCIKGECVNGPQTLIFSNALAFVDDSTNAKVLNNDINLSQKIITVPFTATSAGSWKEDKHELEYKNALANKQETYAPIDDYKHVEEYIDGELSDRGAEEKTIIAKVITSTEDVLKEEAEEEVFPKPGEHIRGSMRFLQVPFVESSPGNIEQIPIKDMPPALIAVDGLLDDVLWRKAVLSGDFWVSLENKPPTDQTEVLVARDSNYLYFAFRLHDSKPEEIQATKTVRDTGFGYDDSITIELDTFFNRRDISQFSLNPLGTQTDDIADGRSTKIEWKGDWFGAAVRSDEGWTAEFAIPFAILNYQQKNTVFGVNFKRYHSRTKEYSLWADVTPQNLPEEMGQLQGLELPSAATSDRKSWTFMPFVLAGKNIPDKEGEIKDSLFTGGIDIRYQPRPDLTGIVSLNPDFSQVETAVTNISFSYSEKSVGDNRPFFVEGGGYFGDDEEYFYSNRVADFDFGGKSFGRTGNSKFGILATSAPDDRYDGAARLLYELNDTHSAAVILTATSQSTFNNALAVAQFEGRQTSGLEYSLDAAMTDTRDVDEPGLIEDKGGHYNGMLGWKEDYWYVRTNADKYDVEFFPALGLLDEDLPGTRAGSLTAGYYREQSEYFWRVIDSYAGFKYRETEDGQLQNRKWFTGGSVEFKNEIRASIYLEEGPYRPVTDVRGVFEDYTYQDRYYSSALDFNTRSSVYSYGIQYDWGNLGGGDYNYLSAYAWVRPISEIYLSLSYEQTDSYGIYRQTIFTGSWEITPEDSLGARYIFYKSDDGTDDYFRVTYGRKARKGLDIFVVYDKDPYSDEQYSLKLVYTL